MKLLLLICFLCAVTSHAQVKGCKTDYDKFKDKTTYRCAGILKTGLASFLTVEVVVSKEGETRMIFSSVERSWKLNTRQLIVLANGNRTMLPNGLQDGDVTSRGYVRQWVTFDIPRELLEQMASSQKVEMQLGQTEGSLDSGLIKKLKAVLTILPPPRPQ